MNPPPPPKKKRKKLLDAVKHEMSIKEVTKTDKIEWRKIIHVVDLD